ncbi:MAG: AraC family transcriptional regulator [Aureispira sp.]
MLRVNKILEGYHSNEFKFHVCSNENAAYNEKIQQELKQPHISNHYYFYYLIHGNSSHKIDLDTHELSSGQLIFVCPNQIHQPALEQEGNVFFKLYFEEQEQYVLRGNFAFLTNILNTNRINFSFETQQRISFLFNLLMRGQEIKELRFSYLNVLLEEFNLAYLEGGNRSITRRNNQEIASFVAFKVYISEHLTFDLSIEKVVKVLGMSSSSLYKVVKKYTNKSPKEYLTDLLIIEAKRRLFYSNISVKELAYSLGFSDPSYFSRIFKKKIGKSITDFTTDLSIR